MIPDGDWVMPQKPLFVMRVCINKRLNTDKLPNCAGRGSRGLADQLEKLTSQFKCLQAHEAEVAAAKAGA